jgi:hypothetical protein
LLPDDPDVEVPFGTHVAITINEYCVRAPLLALMSIHTSTPPLQLNGSLYSPLSHLFYRFLVPQPNTSRSAQSSRA